MICYRIKHFYINLIILYLYVQNCLKQELKILFCIILFSPSVDNHCEILHPVLFSWYLFMKSAMKLIDYDNIAYRSHVYIGYMNVCNGYAIYNGYTKNQLIITMD